MELLQGRKAETLTALEQSMETRSFRAGEKIVTVGDAGDELFLIRRGMVRIMIPTDAGQSRHLGTFGMSVLASMGIANLSTWVPWSTMIHYTPFDKEGSMFLRIAIDHRVLDGLLRSAGAHRRRGARAQPQGSRRRLRGEPDLAPVRERAPLARSHEEPVRRLG